MEGRTTDDKKTLTSSFWYDVLVAISWSLQITCDSENTGRCKWRQGTARIANCTYVSEPFPKETQDGTAVVSNTSHERPPNPDLRRIRWNYKFTFTGVLMLRRNVYQNNKIYSVFNYCFKNAFTFLPINFFLRNSLASNM